MCFISLNRQWQIYSMSLPARWDGNDKWVMARRGDTCVCFRLWACVKIRGLVFTSLPQVHFSSFSRIRNSKVCFNSLCDSSFVWEGWWVKLIACFSVDFSSILVVCWNELSLYQIATCFFACGSNNRCLHRSGTFPSGFLLPRSLHLFILRCLLTIFTP